MKLRIMMIALLITCVFFPVRAEEYTQTTDSVICFSGIPWECSYIAFEDGIKLLNAEYNKVEHKQLGNGEDSSFSFGVAVIAPGKNFLHAKTDYYIFENERTVNSFFGSYTTSDSILNFGGYKTSRMYACFYETDNLFCVGLNLQQETKNGDMVLACDQFDDLYNKLSSLYGEPYYFDFAGQDLSGGESQTKTYIWIGSDYSAVELKWKNLSGVKYLDGDYVTITYGKTNSTQILAELEEAYEAEYAENYRLKIESISDDISGL